MVGAAANSGAAAGDTTIVLVLVIVLCQESVHVLFSVTLPQHTPGSPLRL